MNDSCFSNVHFMPVLSSLCNAKCKYCFGPNKGQIITAKQFNDNLRFIKKIVDENQQQRVSITFHGGEPLLADYLIWNDALLSIKNEFKNKKVDFCIQSNLWKLDDRFIKLFKKYDVSVGTSLDGPEEINDFQRGEGYFKKTVESIKLLEKANIEIGCIATFTPYSIKNYKQIFDFFISNQLSFTIHGSVQSIDQPPTGFTLSPKLYGELLCNMLDLYIPYRHYIKSTTLDHFCISFLEQTGNVCTFKDCLGMFLALDPLGNIYNCQRFCGKPEYSFGNISSFSSIKDILSSPIAKKIIEHQNIVKEKCGKCEHYKYCKGGCLYNAWAFGGEIDPYCLAYKQVFDKIKDHLIKEMQLKENVDAIILKSAGKKHPVFRKGPVTELCYKNAHPHEITKNAIRIVTVVEIANHSTCKQASVSLKKMGFAANKSSLENLLKSITSPKWDLNNLYIHITTNCQLSCNHCYFVSSDKEEEAHLPIGSLINLLGDARKLNFRQVVFTGGEPLVHPDFAKILNLLKSIKSEVSPMHIVLRSNFVKNMTEVDLENIAYSFTKIIVSLDGDQVTHDARRGNGSYMKTLKNIENYQTRYSQNRETAEMSISCVISKKDVQTSAIKSVESIGQMYNLKVRYKPILPFGRAAQWANSPVNNEVDSFVDLDEMIESTFIPSNTCGMGHNLYIEPNGDSFPCYAFHKPHTMLGNVIKDGLESVILSKDFINLSKHTVDTNAKCKTCKYRYLCGGACRVWGKESTQFDLDASPPNCTGLIKRAEETYLFAFNYLKDNKIIRDCLNL